MIFLAALVYAVRYAWLSFPIISGFTAKNMCSCVFVGGRSPASVAAEELGSFPLSLARYEVNEKDSSVTASVFGFAKKKAIYRHGFGCTLVNEISEADLRKQPFNTVIQSTPAADSLLWPAGDATDPITAPAVDKPRLDKLVQQEVNKTNAKNQHETRALLVLYDRRIVAEKYAPGFDQRSKMLGWSMAKSITSAMIGMLVRQGKLDVKQPAPVPEWQNNGDKRHAITLENLLQQTSGLNFVEDYSKSSDATKMLFEKADMGGYTAQHTLKEQPGTRFYYSSGNSNILSRIIKQTVGEAGYHRFVYDSFFYRTGMYNATIEPDASGTMVGSSYVYATARDWARFGLLYYNQGWVHSPAGDVQLLTPEWINATVQPSAADTFQQYGYQFWLNAPYKKLPSQRKFPAAPADLFYCDGYAGQYVFIIPSRKLIIVRLGFKNFNKNELLRKVLQCVR
ncbi:MAG: serine hydrolase [Ferruginibacter sp.]